MKPTAAALLLAASLTAACAARLNTPGANVPVPAAAPAASVAPDAIAAGDSLTSFAEVAGVANRGAPQPDDRFATLAFGAPMASALGVAVDQPLEPGGGPAVETAVVNAANRSSIGMSIPFHTQKDGGRFQGSNCGPATLGMVLDAFGMAHDNAELRLETHTYQGTVGARTGTALQHMAHVAADYGLEPIGLYQPPDGSYQKDGFARWTVDEIRAEVLAGHPVIPLVKFRLLPGHEDSPFRADHYV